MTNQDATAVFLEAVKAGENLVRVDVVLKNAPEDLFGAAFHLRVDGVEWSMERFLAGDALSGSGMHPVILAEEKAVDGGGKEIVFGISMKRTDEFAARDGVLASFYLRTQGDGSLSLEFADTRLSVYNLLARDMDGVLWQAAEFNTGDLSADRRVLQADVFRGFDEGSLIKSDLAVVYMVMLGCLLAVLVATALYFLLKRRRSMRRAGD